MTTKQLTFKWTCGYMGETFYRVTGDGEAYEITWSHRTPHDGNYEYHRTISSHKGREFDDEELPKCGMVRRNWSEIPDHVYAAFLEHLRATHEAELKDIERYWAPQPFDRAKYPLSLPKGRVKYTTKGWVEYGGTPPIAGESDAEYATRLQADRCTLEFAARSSKRVDCGKEPIEYSPLFGGNPQGELF